MTPRPLRSAFQAVRVHARITGGVALLAVLIGVGILWYSLVEGWSVLDAAYMTMITFTTVGFEEVRPLNSDLVIVSRSDAAGTGSKLIRAGATHVVSPYTIGGRRLALSVTRSLTSDFYDALAISSDIDIHMEEIKVAPDSALIGQTVGQVGRDGVHVLALVRATGEVITSPPDTIRIEQGEGLILLGGSDQLQSLDKSL